MRRLCVVTASLICLTGCGQRGSEEAASDTAVEMALVPPSAAGAAPATARAAASPGVAPAPPLGLPMLAYAYDYGVEAPTARVVGLLRSHEQACQGAGASVCQVVGAATQQAGRDQLSARLTFRATPAYVQRFRRELEGQVREADGRIVSREVETEDLTRSIVDTEARLRAHRLLQGRLEQLIASRPGNLAQLLEIERELARVQGEIDAAESGLAVMRARVAMSTVTVNYASRGALITDDTSRPLAAAFDSFLSNTAMALAAIITIVSFALPWALAIAALAWGVFAVQRRLSRRARRPEPAVPGPSPRPEGDPGRPGSS